MDHTSFLNNLLMVREQEIRMLSKKLYQQAALDSDGGSGVSEGSLGSPEPQNLSLSPFRAVSPDAPCPSAPTSEADTRYNDNHASSLASSQPPSRDADHSMRPREQPPLHPFHPLHNRLFNSGDSSAYWDSRGHKEITQESQEGAGAREEEASTRMNESLYEQEHKQQQAALATQALLGSFGTPPTNPHPLLPYATAPHDNGGVADVMGGSNLLVRALVSSAPRRPRGEKKPIPETLKDDKYYERRKRNNMAAKKSRDARKQREDQIAMRATYLEKENSVLRAQVATLREEACSLRQLLFQKKKK